MRPVRLLYFAFFLSWSITTPAQTPAASDPALITRASQAFSAGKSVRSVELTGTAEWTAGSTRDSGPAKLTANVNGENKAEFDLSNGTRVESQSALNEERTCTWSGKDGVVHDATMPNCWTATTWFLPHLALQVAGRPPMLEMQQIGAGEQTAGPSSHIHHQIKSVSDTARTKSAAVGKIIEKLQFWSRTDLEVDPATSLPISLKYTVHPEDNSFVDIPIEVRYSKYQNVSGVELPMHIERYVNGSIQLSIDIDSAVTN